MGGDLDEALADGQGVQAALVPVSTTSMQASAISGTSASLLPLTA